MCDDELVRHAHEEARRFSRRTALQMTGGLAAGGVVGAVAFGASGEASAAPAEPPTTEPQGRRVIDLTHVLSGDFPQWPGNAPVVAVPTSAVGPGNRGFATRWMSFSEHSGTHVDAPAHKIGNGITIDRIAAQDLVAPLAVISIAARARTNRRATLTERDVEEYERRHGRIPRGALVALHSGWQPRTGGPDAPGFDPDAVLMLVRERDVVAIGTDTLSVDVRGAVGAHTAILGAGRYAVEAMANLSSVQPAGAAVVVGVPRFAGGTGAPARVLAVG
ncbi:cyclase family protein [Gordonia insulae]|uniref:Kynurenine formamidase n=1 Tax=Gordonia insulae TaxID=2420509 RepID=A0A3G8JRW1_9ACTN|nr:cyclase family protein [Gordonia insulae]AZG46920.1 Kynurenine formamidase [Gordonia insulae]